MLRPKLSNSKKKNGEKVDRDLHEDLASIMQENMKDVHFSESSLGSTD